MPSPHLARTLTAVTALLLPGTVGALPASPAALVEAMQGALTQGDAAAYLALVDLRDPLFATEHRRFVQDWVSRPPAGVRLTLLGVQAEGERARGQLRWSWRTAAGVQREVTVPAGFTQVGGAWRYAGELFPVTLAGGQVLAQPGQEEVAGAVGRDLGALLARVRSTLGYAPTQPPVLKLYGSAAALSASVGLSLQPVGGWNEPGEAIKLAAPRWPESRATLAHELTHAAVFSRFGEGQARIPWWLHEGLAQFVASDLWTGETRAAALARSVGWQARGELVAWDRLADFVATPESLWPHVYGQGYAFVRYVTGRYGMTRLTAFMEGLASGLDAQVASTRAFGLGFDRVDEDWKAWLGEQVVRTSGG